MSIIYEEPAENHDYGLFDEFLRERISINTVEYVVNKYPNEDSVGKFKILCVFRQRMGFGSMSLTSKLISKMLCVYPLKEILQAQAMFQWYKIQKQINHVGITENECYKRAVIFHNTYPDVYPKLEVNYWWYQWFLKNSIFSQDQSNLDLVDDPGEMHDFEHPDEYMNSGDNEYDFFDNVNENDNIENLIIESFDANNEATDFFIKPEIIYESDSLLESKESYTNYEIIEIDNTQQNSNISRGINENKINQYTKKANKKNVKSKKIGGISKK